MECTYIANRDAVSECVSFIRAHRGASHQTRHCSISVISLLFPGRSGIECRIFTITFKTKLSQNKRFCADLSTPSLAVCSLGSSFHSLAINSNWGFGSVMSCLKTFGWQNCYHCKLSLTSNFYGGLFLCGLSKPVPWAA